MPSSRSLRHITLILMLSLLAACNLPRAANNKAPATGQAVLLTPFQPQAGSSTPMSVPPTLPLPGTPAAADTQTAQPQPDLPTAALPSQPGAPTATLSPQQPVVPLATVPSLNVTLPVIPNQPPNLPSVTPQVSIPIFPILLAPQPITIPAGHTQVYVLGKINANSGVLRYSFNVTSGGLVTFAIQSDHDDLGLDVTNQKSGKKIGANNPGTLQLNSGTYILTVTGFNGTAENYKVFVGLPIRVAYSLQNHTILNGQTPDGEPISYDLLPPAGDMMVITIEPGSPQVNLSVWSFATHESLTFYNDTSRSFIKYDLVNSDYLIEVSSPTAGTWPYKVDFFVCKGCVGW